MEAFLQILTRYLSVLAYYLPHILGTLLLIGLSVFIAYKVKKRPAPQEEGEEPGTEPGESGGFLARRRYRAASMFRLRRNLRRALSLLKANVYGRNYKYQIPWFLMVGETGSGKTEALRQNEITLPLGAPEENLEGTREGWQWWFFDQGIVIDVDGDYILRTDGAPADHRGWRNLLKLLQSNRPQRPIDGVILTIPATDLVGPPETLNERVIKVGEKAAALFEKLLAAQKILGMRFPVYVLVTKCDFVRGFKSFCGELPAGLQQNMLGWSNPYTLDAAYNPSWVDEAFSSLYKNLYQTQLEVIVDGIQVQDADSFFLFPSEFQSLLEPVRTYCNHLFKQSVFHEAFFFRGLYFSGDGSLETTVSTVPAPAGTAVPSESEAPAEGGAAPESFPEPSAGAPVDRERGRLQLKFLKDLFEMKVFPEFRLARPTAKIFIWRSRVTWALRAAVAGVALFWLIGLWWGYHQLNTEKQTLEPLLQDINAQLTALKVRGPEDEETSFNKMALKLLKGMTNINTSTLSSFFIPKSWISDLDDRVRQAMVVAYDKIILKSLFFELEEKVKSTLEEVDEVETFDDKSTAQGPVGFEEIPEVRRLQKVVQDLEELWRNIEVYNGLQKSQDLTQLGQVVKFLFGFDLPVDFYKNAAYYHNALKEVEYRVYDPTIARYLLATPKVRGLAQELFIRLFEENYLLARLEDFATELESVTAEDPDRFAREGVQRFRNLRQQIEEMENLLSSKEFAWMGRPHLDLGPEFKEILDSIEQSAFLGLSLRQEIEESGEEGFRELVFQLRSQATSFTGPLLVQENSHVRLQLSREIQQLKETLDNFLKHDFMQAEDYSEELVTELGPNDRLTWDRVKLEKAVNLHQDYQKFQSRTFPSFPEELKPLVEQTSLWQLERSMNQHIAQAQHLKKIREEFAFSRREDELASEIRNFKRTAPLLGQLMDVFFNLDFTDSSYALFEVVTRHGYHLLGNVDRLLETEGLYEFRDGNFSWWQGATPASLDAFQALDEGELAYYLTIQRERVKHLAREYAEPLVNFLINRTIKRGQLEERLVTKWHRILVELDRYDAKTTSNSLTLLERFILIEMDKIAPENCLEKIPPASLKSPVRDYFGQKLNKIKVELFKQCQRLATDEVERDYSVVQAFFNERLAGKFPFAPLGSRRIVDEADPADLRKFYYLLDRYLDQSLPLLEKSTKFGLSRDNALEFIYLMEEARPFFAPFLALEKSELPAYLLEVEFRVNRKAEVGANQVIEWRMETKGRSVDNFQDKPEPLKWDLGDLIRLTFRWAKNSPDVPIDAGEWPGVRVNKRTVTLEYDNQWSLIHLLRRQQAGIEDFGPLGDPKPHTLRFVIKTLERDEERLGRTVDLPKARESRLFVRVVVKSPKTKERVLLPSLPETAPGLKAGFNS